MLANACKSNISFERGGDYLKNVFLATTQHKPLDRWNTTTLHRKTDNCNWLNYHPPDQPTLLFRGHDSSNKQFILCGLIYKYNNIYYTYHS